MSTQSRLQHPVQPPAGLNPIDHVQRTIDYYKERGYAAYRWASNPDPLPISRLAQPLANSKLALLASGGIYKRGQIGFHYHDDTGYRRVPIDTSPNELGIVHFGYDVRPARQDSNIIFPATTLRLLQQQGKIGALCPDALTFMGVFTHNGAS